MLRTRLIAGRTSGLILSAVFASIVTLASQVEVVLEPLRVDPVRPAPVTLRVPSSYLPSEAARHHRGLPQPLVVRRGEVVNDPATVASGDAGAIAGALARRVTRPRQIQSAILIYKNQHVVIFSDNSFDTVP